MPYASRRRAVTVAAASLSLAAAGPAGLALQSASAAPAKTPGQSQQLLGGILGTITGLLDGTALAQLTALTGGLDGGLPASPAQLAPLTELLSSLGSGAPGAGDVAALLAGSGTDPVNVAFLAKAQELVGQLAALQGLSAGQAGALAALQSALGNAIAGTPLAAAVAPLPLGGLDALSLDPGTLQTQLAALVAQLSAGKGAGGADFDSIVALLTGIPGLPAPVAAAIHEVAAQLDAQQGALPADLAAKVSGLLMSLAATNGVAGTPLATVLVSLSGLLDKTAASLPTGGGGGNGGGGTGGGATGGGSGTGGGAGPTTTTPGSTTTPATTSTPASGGSGAAGATGANAGAAAGAVARNAPKIASVSYDKRRQSYLVTVNCALSKPSCVAVLALTRAGKSVSKPQFVALSSGQVAAKTFKLDATTKRALKRKAVKLKLVSITSRTQVTSRSLKIARTKAAKKRLAKRA